MNRQGPNNVISRVASTPAGGRHGVRRGRGRGATWRLLASSFRGRRRELGGLAAWAAVEGLPAYLSGRLVALATDRGFLARRPEMGFVWLGLLGVAVALGAWASRQIYRRLAAVVEPFRDELVALTVAGTLRRSTAPGAAADTGGVARLTLQVEIVRDAYAGVLMAVQGFLVATVSALIGLFGLAPALLVLVLVPLLAGLGLFASGLRNMADRQRACILADERIAESASAMAAGLRDVIACGGEETVAAGLDREIEAQAAATAALARSAAARTLAAASGGLVPVVLILVAGPWLVRHGATTGAILGALTYVLQGVLPAVQTLTRELGGTGLWLLVALDRIVAATTTDTPERPRTPAGDQTGFSGYGVALRGVTFRYGLWAQPIIEDLDLDIDEGDHLAVVGPSGVGKSTLAGLVAGILQPEAGEVLMGNTLLRDLDVGDLTRHRLLIPQEAYVFAGTLGENLSYLQPGATTEQIDEAVDVLGIKALTQRLGGYGAEVDASTLSAGERQLITLVRAYLSSAELVILDEATCHLDPVAEARVEQAFARRPGSLVVVAHRISSALRARRVLVMDGAQVLPGSHADLLERSPLYRNLVGHWVVPTRTAPEASPNGAGRPVRSDLILPAVRATG